MRPEKPPEVPGELSKPKHTILVNKCNTKVMVFGTGSKLYFFALGPGKPPGGSKKPPDLLSTLPVEEKAFVEAFVMRLRCPFPFAC